MFTKTTAVSFIFFLLFIQSTIAQNTNEIKNEKSEWDSIEKSLSIKDFQNFTKIYPNSKYLKNKGFLISVLPEDSKRTDLIGYKDLLMTRDIKNFDLYIEKIGRGKKVNMEDHKKTTIITANSPNSSIEYPSGRKIFFQALPNKDLKFEIRDDGSLEFISGSGLVMCDHNNKKDLFGFNTY